MLEYNTVKFTGIRDYREQSLSEGIARKLNACGDSLIKPHRDNYEGRNYEVIRFPSGDVIIKNKSEKISQKNPLTRFEKIRGFIGSCFKNIAASICKEIREEFKAADKGEKSYFLKPRASYPINKAEGQNENGSDALSACCSLLCCPIFCLLELCKKVLACFLCVVCCPCMACGALM